MNLKTIIRFFALTLFLSGSYHIVEAQEKKSIDVTTVIKICAQDEFGSGLHAPSSFGCDDTTLPGTIVLDRRGNPLVEVELFMFAANLDGVNVASWPTGLDLPYLRYEYAPNQFRYTEAFMLWEHFGNSSANGGDHPLFKASTTVAFKYDYDCGYGQDDYLIISRDIQLVTMTGPGVYIPYPFSEFTNSFPGGVFSCEVFDETCHFCQDLCTEGGLPSYSIDICTECLPRPTIGRSLPSNEEALSSLSVQPNPFSDQVEYRFHAKENESINVSLFSVDGKIISQDSRSAIKGNNSYFLNTEDIPLGIYYLRISNGEQQQTSRIIKME